MPRRPERRGGKKPHESSADDLARKSSNPLGGDFIIWFNLFDLNWEQGDITDKTRYSYTYELQPVIPIPLPGIGEGWVWVNRPTLPVVLSADLPTAPDPNKPGKFEFDSKGAALGDVQYFTLLGKQTPMKTGWLADLFGEGEGVLAGGFTTLFPTGGDDFTSNVWAAGPAATAAYVGKKWVVGALAQQWFSYSKEGHADDFSSMATQLFYLKNFPGGWQVGGTPIITADWEADSDNRWSVPLGLGVFKTTVVGKLPIKFGVEARYYIVQPDAFGTEWQIEFSITPLTPNFVANLFK